MNFTTFTKIVAILALATVAFAQGGPRGYGAGNGTGTGDGSCCILTGGTPTADEAKWLTFMREEEKLARDVYTKLYQKWNLRVFANIARSEQRHFESIGDLMAAYKVAEPASGTTAGVYTDPRLSALYAQLIAKGMLSQADALEVGILIEKTDIADLETALKATTKTDIKTVYSNLHNASLQHQEAFESVHEVCVP